MATETADATATATDESTSAASTAAEETTTPPAQETTTDDPGADDRSDHAKEQSRRAYELRQKAKRADDLEKELEGYKRREDEARKAKLTEEQRLKEERDEAVARATKLESDILKQKVAAEFKLPSALVARLIGTDEAALRADAEELAKLLPKPRVGSTTEPVREGQQGPRIYKRSELMNNPELARSPEVMKAYQEGRIVNDLRR
jgi:hypothetical protein